MLDKLRNQTADVLNKFITAAVLNCFSVLLLHLSIPSSSSISMPHIFRQTCKVNETLYLLCTAHMRSANLFSVSTRSIGRKLWMYLLQCIDLILQITFSWYLHMNTLCDNLLLSKSCWGIFSANLLLPISVIRYSLQNKAYVPLIDEVRCLICIADLLPSSLRMVLSSFLPGAGFYTGICGWGGRGAVKNK